MRAHVAFRRGASDRVVPSGIVWGDRGHQACGARCGPIGGPLGDERVAIRLTAQEEVPAGADAGARCLQTRVARGLGAVESALRAFFLSRSCAERSAMWPREEIDAVLAGLPGTAFGGRAGSEAAAAWVEFVAGTDPGARESGRPLQWYAALARHMADLCESVEPSDFADASMRQWILDNIKSGATPFGGQDEPGEWPTVRISRAQVRRGGSSGGVVGSARRVAGCAGVVGAPRAPARRWWDGGPEDAGGPARIYGGGRGALRGYARVREASNSGARAREERQEAVFLLEGAPRARPRSVRGKCRGRRAWPKRACPIFLRRASPRRKRCTASRRGAGPFSRMAGGRCGAPGPGEDGQGPGPRVDRVSRRGGLADQLQAALV